MKLTFATIITKEGKNGNTKSEQQRIPPVRIPGRLPGRRNPRDTPTGIKISEPEGFRVGGPQGKIPGIAQIQVKPSLGAPWKKIQPPKKKVYIYKAL